MTHPGLWKFHHAQLRNRGSRRRRRRSAVRKLASRLPPPPRVGPADSYFHAAWFNANEDEPVEYYDELDADRYCMRCVRKYRDGRLEACSYASDNWRDEMPEGPIPPTADINRDPQFSAKGISKAPGTCATTTSSSATPWAARPSSAPANSGAVTLRLNRDTTMPNRSSRPSSGPVSSRPMDPKFR